MHITSQGSGIDILNEIVRRLVQAYQPERIYLFGSRARGEGGQDSDYDLLVVVPDSAAAERRASRLAYRVLRGTGTAADVLVWTHSAFESRLHLKASLPATVLAEGRLLHIVALMLAVECAGRWWGAAASMGEDAPLSIAVALGLGARGYGLLPLFGVCLGVIVSAVYVFARRHRDR